jgi:hypothetical protein
MPGAAAELSSVHSAGGEIFLARYSPICSTAEVSLILLCTFYTVAEASRIGILQLKMQ